MPTIAREPLGFGLALLLLHSLAQLSPDCLHLSIAIQMQADAIDRSGQPPFGAAVYQFLYVCDGQVSNPFHVFDGV